MGEHERRALRPLDHAGDRKGLAAAGDSQQHLILRAVVQTVHEGLDRGGLITLRLILRMKFEAHVKTIIVGQRFLSVERLLSLVLS